MAAVLNDTNLRRLTASIDTPERKVEQASSLYPAGQMHHLRKRLFTLKIMITEA
jgi:hypothetical protein